MKFETIKSPYWDDAPVYLVGGGPSLRGFDFSRLKGKGHVVGVNRAMFDCPCECGVSIDHQFITNFSNSLYDFGCNHTLYLAVGEAPRLPHVSSAMYLRTVYASGLSLDPEFLHKGSTSGYAALGIALLKRARMIILLGYDYSTDGPVHHYHSDYPWYNKASDQSWGRWSLKYGPAACDCLSLGVKVLNASLNSALPYFKKITLEEALDVASLSAVDQD